jgi:hypothetical protein
LYNFISLRPKCSQHPVQSIFFLTVKDQISHSCKSMGKTVVLYLLIAVYVETTREKNAF